MTVNSESVTSYDVARAAQVSVGTVIRVLNNKPNVDEEIRERVLQAIEELGYVYVPKKKQVEPPLVRVESALKSVMLCVPPMFKEEALQEIYYYTVLRGTQKGCAENDLHLMYNVISDNANGLTQLRTSLEGKFVDGLVLVNYGSKELVEGIVRLQVPLVLIEPRTSFAAPLDTVESDDFAGGKLVVEHLLALGHRAIACIGTDAVRVTKLRFDGYRIALYDAQLPYRPELFVRVEHDLSVDAGREAMQHLLETGAKFSAVFCMNDNIALGALQTLRAAGLRVPEDVSIVGFDNHEGAALSNPALTTIHGAPQEKGSLAIQRLLDRVIRPHMAVTHSVLPVHLVTRASTMAL